MDFGADGRCFYVCRFLLLGDADRLSRNERTGRGLFRLEDPNGNCVRYPDGFKNSYFDAGIEIAQYVAVLACFLIGSSLVLIFLLRYGCLKDCICTWNIARCSTYLALYCTLFSFFIFGWDYCRDAELNGLSECTMGSAAIMSVVNVVLLQAVVFLGFFVNAGSCPSATNDEASGSPAVVVEEDVEIAAQ